MKKFKKLTGLFLCIIVLTAGCLTGCGGKSDITILTTALKTITSAKNFDMSMKMNGKVSASEEGESVSLDIDTGIKATWFADPFKMKYTATAKLFGQSSTYEGYVQKEGDQYVCYVKAGDEWAKSSMDDEGGAVMSKINSMKNQLSEDVSKYTRKDDIEENGKKYLTYEYTVTADSLKNALESLSSSLESQTEDERKEEEKAIDEIVKVIGDSKLTVLIDRETETIYQIRYPVADAVRRMADLLADDLWDDRGAKEEKEKEDAMKLDVSGMDLIISYTNVGSAADFEVPKEALEAEDISETVIDDDIDDECED